MEFARRLFEKIPESAQPLINPNARQIMNILDRVGYASYTEVVEGLVVINSTRGEQVIGAVDTMKLIDGLREKGLVERVEHPEFTHTDFWELTEKVRELISSR